MFGRKDIGRASVASGIALSCGFLTGYIFLVGFPRMTIQGLIQVLPFLLVLFVVWSLLELHLRSRRLQLWQKTLLWLGRLVLAALPAHILTQRGALTFELSNRDFANLLPSLVAMAGLWWLAVTVASRVSGIALAPAWGLTTTGLSISLLLSRTASLSQLAGTLAGTLAGVIAVAVSRPQLRMYPLASSVALIWFALGGLGMVYGLPILSVCLLLAGAFSPVAAAPFVRDGYRLPGAWYPVLSGLAALLLSAAAVGVSFRKFGPPMTF
ncbi:MAG: hypothetical protein V2G51_07615 [bacterium JZ-2024 1]